jgi:hypothetical protein
MPMGLIPLRSLLTLIWQFEGVLHKWLHQLTFINRVVLIRRLCSFSLKVFFVFALNFMNNGIFNIGVWSLQIKLDGSQIVFFCGFDKVVIFVYLIHYLLNVRFLFGFELKLTLFFLFILSNVSYVLFMDLCSI